MTKKQQGKTDPPKAVELNDDALGEMSGGAGVLVIRDSLALGPASVKPISDGTGNTLMDSSGGRDWF